MIGSLAGAAVSPNQIAKDSFAYLTYYRRKAGAKRAPATGGNGDADAANIIAEHWIGADAADTVCARCPRCGDRRPQGQDDARLAHQHRVALARPATA